MEPITIAVIALALTIWLFLSQSRKGKCNVPGPYGIPFLGYLPFLGKQPHEKLLELKSEYGDLVQLKLGSQTVLVLNSLPVIKEALGRWEFSDRPHTHSFRVIQDLNLKQGYHGIAFFSRGPKWDYLRRVAVRALNNLVVSPRNKLEDYTRTALVALRQRAASFGAQGGSIRRPAFDAVNSVVSAMNFATYLSPDHPVLTSLFENQELFGRFIATNAMTDFVPILRPLASKNRKMVEDRFLEIGAVMREMIQQHQFNPDICDVQDAIEYVIRSDNDPDAMTNAGFSSISEVKHIAQDLFGAGTFTTTEHFLFFIRCVALCPEVQDKMREEISKLSPPAEDGWVSLKRKNELPYCRAVEEEVFRFTSQLPLSISHWTTQDTTLRGYHIPKDTMVLPNLWALHRDAVVFLEPDAFRPQRFLGPDGAFDEAAARNVLPFSYGKRRCPGELMARRELFLLYANFVTGLRVGPQSWLGRAPFDAAPGFTRILPDATFAFAAL